MVSVASDKELGRIGLSDLLVYALLSVLLHIFGLVLASHYRAFESIKIERPEATEVSLLETPKNFRDALETLQETSKEAPKNAKFVSERNLKTEEETSPQAAPSPIPQAGGAQSKAQPKVKPEKLTEGSKLKFSFSQKDLVAQNQTETLRPDLQGRASAGFYDRLKRGTDLKVNAFQSDYANYINRMKRKLSQYWSPQRTVTAAMYNYSEVRTEIAVILNKEGEIVELRSLNRSLFPAYDDEALRALKESGPYPNPPDSLIQDDGFIYMPWTFVMQTSGWGMASVE